MCRSIRPLFNFDPPATDEEIRAAALQFVRKVAGTRKPSKANETLFDESVEQITAITRKLVHGMTTKAPPKDRDVEREKSRERFAKRRP